MFLDAAAAIVSADKLRDYLLSSAHPIGRYKSAFFRSLGYAQDQWHVLERDLRAVLSNEAQPAGVMEYVKNSPSEALFWAQMGAPQESSASGLY
jgi:hypothetical protein